MSSNPSAISAQVLLKITGPICGIKSQVSTTTPLKDIFQGVTAVSLWLVMVNDAFPRMPRDFLAIGPEDTFAGVADRIAEYINR